MGERYLEIYLPESNARYDIARKIIGALEIKRVCDLQNSSSTRHMWYCPVCKIFHDSDDEWLPCAVIVEGDSICGSCGMESRYCVCSYNNACPECGCDPCECYTGDNCPDCGQPPGYCFCGSERCEYCDEIFCTTDHSSENSNDNSDRSKIQCNDVDISNLLDRFAETDLGKKVFSTLKQLIEIHFVDDQKSQVRINYTSDGTIIDITIRNDASDNARTTGVIEDVIHAAQLGDVGYDEFSDAKLNYEIEAKCLTAIFFADHDGLFEPNDINGYHHIIVNLAQEFYYFGYDRQFDGMYQDAVDYYRNNENSTYSDETVYPEDANHRNFETFNR